MSSPIKTVGQRLREERKRLGLSQTEFAKTVGVHLNTQSRYEKGEREPDTAYLDAIRKTGVDVGYVVGYSLPTPAEKLNDFHVSLKVGGAGEQAKDIFDRAILWVEGRYDGDRAGLVVLNALGVAYCDWNRIVEKLVRLDESGIPYCDTNDPAWASELAKASGQIRQMLDYAAELDSALLVAVIGGIEGALSSSSRTMPVDKKAKAVAMLYRAFKASGKVDPAMIEEAVKLAAD